jgi:hypothetical protein
MTAVLIVLAAIVVVVAVDAIGRLDERGKREPPPKDPSITTSQKIVVDLSKRD